eukprot:6260633-Pyramimonas_sp.AAC.1
MSLPISHSESAQATDVDCSEKQRVVCQVGGLSRPLARLVGGGGGGSEDIGLLAGSAVSGVVLLGALAYCGYRWQQTRQSRKDPFIHINKVSDYKAVKQQRNSKPRLTGPPDMSIASALERTVWVNNMLHVRAYSDALKPYLYRPYDPRPRNDDEQGGSRFRRR